MPNYLHAIGNSPESLQTLEELGITIPENDFSIGTDEVLLMSKKIKNVGSPTEAWHWNVIRKVKRDTLKTFCPGKSSNVTIVTIDNEGEYKTFNCLMVWPSRERQRAGRIIDFTINFMFLVEVEVEVS